jgi:hypothetical protein
MMIGIIHLRHAQAQYPGQDAARLDRAYVLRRGLRPLDGVRRPRC